MVDARTGGYVDAVVELLRGELGEDLAGVYLFGSVALEDYRPPRSDLDIAVVTERRLRPPEGASLAAPLDHRRLACPARRLELVVYARERLAAAEVAFELDLNTGPGLYEWRDDPRTAPSPWFVLDVAIGREHGRAVIGPPAGDVFPVQPEDRIIRAIGDSLDWHIGHGRDADGGEADPADTVLNACRAWRFLEERTWSSKTRAGRWALGRNDSSPVVAQALARREAGEPGPAAAAAQEFAAGVRRLALQP